MRNFLRPDAGARARRFGSPAALVTARGCCGGTAGAARGSRTDEFISYGRFPVALARRGMVDTPRRWANLAFAKRRVFSQGSSLLRIP